MYELDKRASNINQPHRSTDSASARPTPASGRWNCKLSKSWSIPAPLEAAFLSCWALLVDFGEHSHGGNEHKFTEKLHLSQKSFPLGR